MAVGKGKNSTAETADNVEVPAARAPMVHLVRSWKHLFWPLATGVKKHDLRINDRDYRVGDTLVLREWDPETGEYSGQSIRRRITYITDRNCPCAFKWRNTATRLLHLEP